MYTIYRRNNTMNRALRIAAILMAILAVMTTLGCNRIDEPVTTQTPSADTPAPQISLGPTVDPMTMADELTYSQFVGNGGESNNPYCYLIDNPDNLQIQQYAVGETVQIGEMTVRAIITSSKEYLPQTTWDLYINVNGDAKHVGTMETPFFIKEMKVSLTAIDFEGDGFDPDDLMINMHGLPYIETYMYGNAENNPYAGRIYRVTANGDVSAEYRCSNLAGNRMIYPEYRYDGEALVLKSNDMTVSNHYCPLHDNEDWYSFEVIKEFEIQGIDASGMPAAITVPAGSTIQLTNPPDANGPYGDSFEREHTEDLYVLTEYGDGYVNYEWLKESGCIKGDITIIEYLVLAIDYEFEILKEDGEYASEILEKGTMVRLVTYNPEMHVVIFETYDGRRGRIQMDGQGDFNSYVDDEGKHRSLFIGGEYSG